MRKWVLVLIAFLYFLPSSGGNRTIMMPPQGETILLAAGDINPAQFTSSNHPASSCYYINSQHKINAGFSTRSHAFMPAVLLSTTAWQGHDTLKIIFRSPHQTCCTRIGLQLLFPKHYFW